MILEKKGGNEPNYLIASTFTQLSFSLFPMLTALIIFYPYIVRSCSIWSKKWKISSVIKFQHPTFRCNLQLWHHSEIRSIKSISTFPFLLDLPRYSSKLTSNMFIFLLSSQNAQLKFILSPWFYASQYLLSFHSPTELHCAIIQVFPPEGRN